MTKMNITEFLLESSKRETRAIGRVGCDNCGEAKPVHLAGKHYPMNKKFLKVYLCDECEKLEGGEKNENVQNK